MTNRIRTALALLLVVSSGCATTKEVQEIVSRTNAAMISPGRIGQKGETKPAWEVESARIEAFIEANPDADVTNAALRVRQGMLLATHKQDAYALLAFEQIKDRDQLVSERDRALYDLHEHIVWWFKVSEEHFGGEPPTAAGKKGTGDYEMVVPALAAFREVCNGLPPGSSARNYLEEMRAWIAATYAKDLTVAEFAQSAIEDGLSRYASQFSEDDINWIKDNTDTNTHDLPFLVLKARLRAKAVVERYWKVASDQGLSLDQVNDKAQALLKAIPAPG